MKLIIVLVALLVLGGVLITSRAVFGRALANGKPASPEEVSKGLRNLALNLKPKDLKIESTFTGPYGIVMDMDFGGKTATLTSFSSGDASLYFSSGGGIIGSGQGSDAVASAARRFVDVAAEFIRDMSQTQAHPLPGAGEVIFYVLTPQGTFAATRDQQALREKNDKLSALYYAGQDVITQIRLLQERQDKARQQFKPS